MKNNPFPILAYSDMHFPFQHKKTFSFLRHIKETYKPKTIVCCGDVVDNHSVSFFKPETSAYSAAVERKKALNCVKELYQIFPDQIVLLGNHCRLPERKLKEIGLGPEYLKSYNELFEVPDSWDFTMTVEIGGVFFNHKLPTGPSGALNAAIRKRQSFVGGHTHSSGGIQYHSNSNSQIFGLNLGCLVDEKKYAFSYARESLNRPTLGAGLILSASEAYFIPLVKGSSCY